MILNTSLTPAEQRAFDLLLGFFRGEKGAERKAFVLSKPLARLAQRTMGEVTEATIQDLVLEILCGNYQRTSDLYKVEYVSGQRRDTLR